MVVKKAVLMALVEKWHGDINQKERRAYTDTEEGRIEEARDEAARNMLKRCASELEQLAELLGTD